MNIFSLLHTSLIIFPYVLITVKQASNLGPLLNEKNPLLYCGTSVTRLAIYWTLANFLWQQLICPNLLHS